MDTLPENVSLLKLLSEPGQSLAAVENALDAGADVNETSSRGFTPLMFAALLNDDPGIVRVLIERNAGVDAENDDGMTALMWALMTETHDHLGHNMTAALAREENRRAAAMEIIKGGADVNAVCFHPKRKGWTPLFFATRDPDKNASIISALIDANANVNAKADDGLTSLILASEHGRSSDVVRLLIGAGADVNAAAKQEGREGWTPLLYALNSPRKSLAIVKELTLAHADVNVVSENGCTPLFSALKFGDNPAVIKLLLDAGACAEARDSEGSSLLDFASAKNYKRIVNFISKHSNTDSVKVRNYV